MRHTHLHHETAVRTRLRAEQGLLLAMLVIVARKKVSKRLLCHTNFAYGTGSRTRLPKESLKPVTMSKLTFPNFDFGPTAAD